MSSSRYAPIRRGIDGCILKLYILDDTHYHLPVTLLLPTPCDNDEGQVGIFCSPLLGVVDTVLGAFSFTGYEYP